MDEDSQALRLLAVEEFLENIKAECLTTVLGFVCVLIKTALRFPWTWLNFRQLSPWLKSPDLYFTAFVLENLTVVNSYLSLRDVNLLQPGNCCTPRTASHPFETDNDYRAPSQTLWVGRSLISMNCKEHQLANTHGLTTLTNFPTDG